MKNSFVAIDFETANARRVSACSLGACLYLDGRLVDRKYVLIKPVGEYAVMNMRIHGITPEMTADAPSFNELFPDLREWFENYPVLGYSNFDKSVFNALVDYYGLELSKPIRYIDVCGLARKAFPELKNHKLPTVAKHLALDDFKHHDAAEDALKCAEIYLRMAGLECKCQTNDRNEDRCECRQVAEGPKYTFEESFSNYLLSIMSDGGIDYKEAYELQCVLQAFSVKHVLFENLLGIVNKIIADGEITQEESDQMMLVLSGVSDLIRKKEIVPCPVCGSPLPPGIVDMGLEMDCPWCKQPFIIARTDLDNEFDKMFLE